LLWAGWSRDRIAAEVRFYALVQTGSGAHPALYAMGAGSPRGKQPEHGVDHLPSPSVELEERIELYLHSYSRLSWPVLG